MTTNHRWWDTAVLVALGLAWVGIWGAWVPHSSAALTQNAPGLASWSSYLNEVRFGDLGLMPDMLRLAVAILAAGAAIAAGTIRSVWWRLCIRGIAALTGFVLLPPYPFVLNPFATGYGFRFSIVVGLCILAAVAFALDRLPEGWRRGVVALLAGVGLALAIWSYARLIPPFAAHYAHPLAPGWGLLAFGVGLAAATVLQVGSLMPRSGKTSS